MDNTELFVPFFIILIVMGVGSIWYKLMLSDVISTAKYYKSSAHFFKFNLCYIILCVPVLFLFLLIVYMLPPFQLMLMFFQKSF